MFKRQRCTCMNSRGYNIRQTYTNKRIDMLTPTEYTLPEMCCEMEIVNGGWIVSTKLIIEKYREIVSSLYNQELLLNCKFKLLGPILYQNLCSL